MSNPKAQFQVDHGSGWQTVAEVDIINGVATPPNAWTMVRALRKQIVYTGCVSVTTVLSNPRDTHFAGFAKALWNELLANTRTFHSDYEESQQTILARRAYDLAMHILMQAPTSSLQHCCSRLEAAGNIEDIPDLIELPKEEREP